MGEFKKGFEPLSEGDYLVRMTSYEEVDTKAGNGRNLKATFQVVNGDAKNRLIFENFLVEHTNPEAEEIGNDRLDKYLKAVGAENGLESLGNDRTKIGEYLEMPFIATVDIEDAREYQDKVTGETKLSKAKNRIKSFKAR